MTYSPLREREPAVPVRFARAALKHAQLRGVDAAALLTRAGIPPALLHVDSARITSDAFAQLLTQAMLAMDDEGLGFYRRPIPVGSWAMMCFAGTNTRLLRTALDRYCRFVCLLDVGLMPALLDVEGKAVLRFARRDASWLPDRFVSESMLVTVHRFTSWLLQEHVPLAWVALPHPRPADVEDYRTLFLGSEVRFEKPHAEIAFGQHFLEQPLQQDAQSVRRFLEAPLLALLTTRYRMTSWTTRVKRLLGAMDLHDVESMEAVAARLHTHPQSLRRRLAEEETSFKSLVDDVRRAAALYQLGQANVTTAQAADRAGFSETSAFIRAFKRWTGLTPHAYRKGAPARLTGSDR